MKQLIVSGLLLLMTGSVMAVPAKKRWITITQSDGTQIEVALTGDEHLHYFTTRDNISLAQTAQGDYCYATVKGGEIVSTGVIAHEATRRTASEKEHVLTSNDLCRLVSKARLDVQASSHKTFKAPRKASNGEDKSVFQGKKKALVILASFSDKSFADSDDEIVDFYNKVLNEEGFSQYGAPGSVHDYFTDASRGQFDLTFDVVGPVRVSKSATYYGGPSVYFGGTDHIGEFITEAITKADNAYDIAWSDYDWNNDGEVEQVFVLYAGYGQATGGATGTIWPNAWTLDEALQNNDGNGGITIDGMYINQYACSNELYNNSGHTKMGLGVFCHEFSHCMGLPDMYDTNYGSTPTMGDWDLLAGGSYNGPNGIGWCPAGWTSYERAYAGWLNLIELQPGDTITAMKGLEQGGDAYVIYNDNHRDEYYLLENHTNTGWDAYTPESGLLIIHVDYDKELFDNNIVNTIGTFTPEEGYSKTLTNDHARMAPFSKVRSISNETYYYTYPINATRGVIDSLTDNSNPAAKLYNALADGSTLMHKPIYNIAKDESTGEISFVFMPKAQGDVTGIDDEDLGPIIIDGDVPLFALTGRRVGKLADAKSGRLPKGLYLLGGKGSKKKIVIK